MQRLNPNALALVLFGAGVGAIINEGQGALIGATICLGITLLAGLLK